MGTGTRSATPSKLPESAGTARVTAIAAPVVEGTIFCAPARPLLQSFASGPSTMRWVAVYACTVESIAFSMPGFSDKIAMIGETELVVHEPFEDITQFARSLSLTPMRIVRASLLSVSFAGAVITTRLAPAIICARDFSKDSKRPVDSTATSTPYCRHGSLATSFSPTNGIFMPSTKSARDAISACTS